MASVIVKELEANDLKVQNERLKAKVDALMQSLQQYEAEASGKAASTAVQRTKIEEMMARLSRKYKPELMSKFRLKPDSIVFLRCGGKGYITPGQ